MRNSYKTTSAWEAWATANLPQKFGLDVYETCTDRKRNHDEGTDAIIRNFCGQRYARIDYKWKRFWDYPDIWFALEDRQKDGTSWVDNQSALYLDVIILHPWKCLWEHTYKLCAYRLRDLHKLAVEYRNKSVQTSTVYTTGTRYWKLTELDLLPYCIWDSGPVNLRAEEEAWKRY